MQGWREILGFRWWQRIGWLREMDKDTFRKKLIRAASDTIETTRGLVVEHIPDSYKFVVLPNRDAPFAGRQIEHMAAYPEDSLKNKTYYGVEWNTLIHHSAADKTRRAKPKCTQRGINEQTSTS